MLFKDLSSCYIFDFIIFLFFYKCLFRSLSKLDLVSPLKKNYVYYPHAKVGFHVLMTNVDLWQRQGVDI